MGQAKDSDLDPIVRGSINPVLEPRRNCGNKGQEAERPDRRAVSEAKHAGSSRVGSSGGTGRVRGEGQWQSSRLAIERQREQLGGSRS